MAIVIPKKVSKKYAMELARHWKGRAERYADLSRPLPGDAIHPERRERMRKFCLRQMRKYALKAV
jgi:hypothetical protein